MSVVENGTRFSNGFAQTVGAPTRELDRSYSADAGVPSATGALVFDPVAGTVTLAGAFAAFQVNAPVLIDGTALNDGLAYVTAVSANALTLTPHPKAETAPATATIRSA